MPRKREVHAVNGHPCEWAGGAVYIRLRRKGDPSAGFVVVSPSGEEMRKRFDDAQRLAVQRAATAGASSAFDELWLTVHHFLEVDPPSSWSEGFVETMKSVLLPWLGTKGQGQEQSPLETPNADLTYRDFDAVIKRLIAAGRSESTERQLRFGIRQLIQHGRNNGFFGEEQDLAPRTVQRKVPSARFAGDPPSIIYPEQLPPWDMVFKVAKVAAEITGCWWEELRVLLIAHLGPRWGEHCYWRGRHFGLCPADGTSARTTRRPRGRRGQGERELTEGQVTIIGKINEQKMGRFTESHYDVKNHQLRIVAHHPAFDEMLKDRIAEVGPGGIMFPAVGGGLQPACRKAGKHVCGTPGPPGWQDSAPWPCYASRGEWRQKVWLKAGVAAGMEVMGWTDNGSYTRKDGTYKEYRRPSSLEWTEHDLRHKAATYLIDPKSTEHPDEWWRGRGLSPTDGAYVLGDTLQTFLDTYVEVSEYSAGRVHASMRD